VAARTSISRTYRFAMAVNRPVVRTWGRLQVDGLEHLPGDRPLLIVCNHDSHWDPVAIGVAAMPHRQIRALAKASMWKRPGLAQILNGMGQIPIQRGAGDGEALATAITELRAGACIGIFPEGTLSFGKVLRARSGVGRLAIDVPQTRVVCCAVEGTVDLVRVPKRPRIRVAFFPPAEGGPAPGEAPGAFAERLIAEIRERAPRAVAGRRPQHAEA
jgi:1-acyl-sn-glycerol-3-phosphate acyltransferase